MASAEADVESAFHAGEHSVGELGTALVDYGIPLIGGVAGFLAVPGFIGGNALWTALNNAGVGNYVAPTRIVGLILGGILLLIGGMLWAWGSSKSATIWRKAIGRSLGALGLGGGLSYIWNQTIMNTPIAAGKGILDQAQNAVNSAIQGG